MFQAAEGAARQMGRRRFWELMEEDEARRMAGIPGVQHSLTRPTASTWLCGTRRFLHCDRYFPKLVLFSLCSNKTYHPTSLHSTPPSCTPDPLDVTSLQEYMQFASITDNLAAELGGRDNGWRPLQPEGTPAHHTHTHTLNCRRRKVVASACDCSSPSRSTNSHVTTHGPIV